MREGRSLNALRPLQRTLQKAKLAYHARVWGSDIHPSVLMSLSVRIDRTNPAGVHIAEHVYVAFGASILSHDMTRGLYADTVIERNCFIGATSFIMPGVRIGEGSIVAAGSVVTRDLPPACIVAGNPAVVVREGIDVGRYGRFSHVDKPAEPVVSVDPAD